MHYDACVHGCGSVCGSVCAAIVLFLVPAGLLPACNLWFSIAIIQRRSEVHILVSEFLHTHEGYFSNYFWQPSTCLKHVCIILVSCVCLSEK
jgi:hypothetical protein